MTQLEKYSPTIVKLYIFIKLFLQGFQKWHYFCDRGKSENMIADQNVKFEKKFLLISRRFSPWSLSVKHGCEPQQTICIDGSWLEEHKSGFKFYVGYSMMKI